MTDSSTTLRQKRETFDELERWVIYLQTHNLGCIDLADLRIATRALGQTRVGVPGEDEMLVRDDPLWLAFRAGIFAALPNLVPGHKDWAEIKEEYRKYRRTLEE